jgi:putative nucleotidyltransferase with HDIG domain
MNDNKKSFFGKHARIITQVSLLLICIGIIVFFMPRYKYTNYSFSHNIPWGHEQIIAEFDFIVKKSNIQVKQERESIKSGHIPSFTYKERVRDEKLKTFMNLYGMSDTLKEYRQCLDNLYKDGIVSDADAKKIREHHNSNIKVVHNGKETRTNAQMFASVSEAYDILTKADTLQESYITSLGLKRLIEPNYVCDTALTNAELKKKLSEHETRIATILKGQKIINRGEIVDSAAYRTIETYIDKLNDLEQSKATGNKFNIFMGQVLFVITAMFILLAYIYTYRKNIAENINKFTFTILAATIFPVLVGIVLGHGGISVFVLPFAIVPMMLCLFIDHDTAFVTHAVTIMMCSIMLGSPYEFVMLQLFAGMSAILSLKELSSRSQMFRCVIATFITYAAVYMCYELIVEADLSKMKYNMYIYFTISAILMLLVYPMMFLVEKTFGFISNVTLIELSNLNSKLLHRMSQEAPGTFQHSMQVGNLAAEAARAIGANSLEVRTGALYHDLGKMENPIYFTENQSGGINPHNTLGPLESALIIKKHVTDGLAIAEHEHLPRKIKEFISTHHGNSKTGYFYIEYKNAHPDEEIDEAVFTYPGPKPSTKEQAVLMLADCVEAASHSLKEYTKEKIDEMVNNIIDKKLHDGELSHSPITFQDIEKIKGIFKKRLEAIYHTRISYPSEKKN